MAEMITEQRLKEQTARRVAEVARKIADMRKGDLICKVCLMTRREKEREGRRRDTMCWCDVDENEE